MDSIEPLWIEPSQPDGRGGSVVLLGVAVTMALVGLLAASIPARRALAINPMDLLREQ